MDDVGSNVVVDAVAVLISAVCVVTFATTARVAVTPLASEPTVQVPAEYEPCEGVDDTSVNPGGSVSATETPAAASGPLLTTDTVNVTFALSAGVALSTVFVTRRSASGTLTVADAALLVAFGSNWSAEADAELVIARCEVTFAMIDNVAVTPVANDPTVQVPAAYDPWEGVDDTSVSPAGSASATDTLVAPSGPLFTTDTVNVTLVLSVGVALVTDLVTSRSASGTLTVAEAALLVMSRSY